MVEFMNKILEIFNQVAGRIEDAAQVLHARWVCKALARPCCGRCVSRTTSFQVAGRIEDAAQVLHARWVCKALARPCCDRCVSRTTSFPPSAPPTPDQALQNQPTLEGDSLADPSCQAVRSEDVTLPLVTSITRDSCKEELTLDGLKNLIEAVSEQIHDLEENTSSGYYSLLATSEWNERKQSFSDYMKSLPEKIQRKIIGGPRELILTMVKEAFGGIGSSHWAAMACCLVWWTLDNVDKMDDNRAKCMKMLRKVEDLLKNTIKTWEQINKIGNDGEDVERLSQIAKVALECAIFSTLNLEENIILRFLRATSVELAFQSMEKDLDDARVSIGDLKVARLLEDIPTRRQPRIRDDERIQVLESRTRLKEKAMEFYLTNSDDASPLVLFLHGMGGVGKSTLGLEIFKEFQKSEESGSSGKHRCLRVELSMDVCEKDLPNIQEEIIEKLNPRQGSPKLRNTGDGIQHIITALEYCPYPVFLYVDNVLKADHIIKLLPPAEHFRKGSKILVTARGEDVKLFMKVDLGMENVHSLKVDTLSYEESRKLMLQLTRGNASQAAHLSDVLELCQGLPLALRLVARYVRMQCILGNVDADVKTIWEKIAGIMRECKPFPGADVDIYMHLRFGINILPDVEDRRAFLDIVFMMKMDRALLYPRLGWIDWKTVEEFVGERHVEVLSSAGLVEKHWQYRYGEWRWIPKVHDVLLQIGGQMVWVGGHGIRIVGEDELSQISRASWPEVVALCDVEIEAVHLSQMPRLRYLFHVRICSTSLPGLELNDLVAVRGSNDTHFVTLPKVVYFRWKMNNSAASLEFLRKSRGLRQVILIDWSNLQNVDAIESLTALQRLNFESCNSITTLPSGISGLTSLTDLSFTSSQNSFNSLQDIPRGISSLRKLKVLNLCACTRIEALPEEIGQLTALETIKLSRCSNLSTLPEGISYLTGLKHLDLGACVGLTTLPHGLARLTALENLNLTGSKLETIPNGISHLTALRNLKLSGCQALTCLPEGISSLTRLEILDLWSCDRLQTLPNGISKLTALTTLILWRCSNLRTLPAGITSMVGLRELDLRYCSNLESLPPGISALTASEDISLEGCYEGIPLSESFKPGSSKKTRLSAGLISFLFRQRTHASKRAFTDTFRTLLTSMGISVSQKEDRPMASAPPNL